MCCKISFALRLLHSVRHPRVSSSLLRLELTMQTDAWFVEDEKLLGPHPKDPYKRVETIPSSREIRIEVDGVEIAKSTQSIFLFETMLRPRYYLGTTSVKWEYLSESGTTSYCPYKGMAKYTFLCHRQSCFLTEPVVTTMSKSMTRRSKMRYGIMFTRLRSLYWSPVDCAFTTRRLTFTLMASRRKSKLPT